MGIAGDLGIMDSTLSAWLKAAGVAVRGQAPVRARPHHRSMRRPRRRSRGCGPGSVSSRTNERKLSTEREILRAAAKYFAGETNW